MPILLRIVAIAVVFAAVIGGAFFAGFRLLRPTTSYLVVEETTLLALDGDVSIQRADGRTLTANPDLALQAGDRVRTGATGYAVITYVDGSTTALDPNTDLLLPRLDLAPGGVVSVDIDLRAGGTWTRMERLIDTSTRIDVTTAAASAVAHGGAFRVIAEASGRTAVEAVLDSVQVEGGGLAIQVEPGQRSIIEPGQQPGAPRATPPERFALRLDVDGPVRPFLTDSVHRSVGFHPESEAFISQMPGAVYALVGNQRFLYVPEPLESYQVVLKGQGGGGAFTVASTAVVDGRAVADASVGLSAPLVAQFSGYVGPAQLLGSEVQVRRPDVQFRGSFESVSGAPPGSRSAVVQRQLRTGARAAETAAALAAPSLTATATVPPSLTPTVTSTATRSAGATSAPLATSDPRPVGPTALVPTAAFPVVPVVATPTAVIVAPTAALPVATAPVVPATAVPVVGTAVLPVPTAAPVATARPTDAPNTAPTTVAPPTAATVVILPSIAIPTAVAVPTTAPAAPTTAPVQPTAAPVPPTPVVAPPTVAAPPPTIALPVGIPTLPPILLPTASP